MVVNLVVVGDPTSPAAEAYRRLRVNLMSAGQEVPYVHFHIIPRRAGDGLGYRWHAKKADPAALAALAGRIRAEP